MPTNTAAWLVGVDQPISVGTAPYTEPGKGELVVKVKAVAFNPADGAQQQIGLFIESYPVIVGCDMAGIVEAVGPDVTRFKPGDRVLSCSAHCGGLVPELSKGMTHAAYQNYAVAMACVTTKLPDSVTFAQGAVVPLAMATAASALFNDDTLNLPLPPSRAGEGKVAVVWGGSSSVGSTAIQLYKISGFEVFTMASKKNWDFCREVGADKVFDYHDDDVVEQVLSALKGKTLGSTFKAVTGDDVLKALVEIIQKSDGVKKIVTVMPGEEKNVPEGIDGRFCDAGTFPHNITGEAIFGDFLTSALADGSFKCKPDPMIVGEGLESIQKGMDAVRAGVSAAKVVVTL